MLIVRSFLTFAKRQCLKLKNFKVAHFSSKMTTRSRKRKTVEELASRDLETPITENEIENLIAGPSETSNLQEIGDSEFEDKDTFEGPTSTLSKPKEMPPKHFHSQS